MPASNGFRIHTKGGRSNFHRVNYLFVYPNIIIKNNVKETVKWGGVLSILYKYLKKDFMKVIIIDLLI